MIKSLSTHIDICLRGEVDVLVEVVTELALAARVIAKRCRVALGLGGSARVARRVTTRGLGAAGLRSMTRLRASRAMRGV